ncbi:hypothetical protein AB0K52_01230 [Glycomyces sp. NPDC049804]|uniref:hypothetical protein n=1 Tax=Glycomyces sp. NPDC049804 TaxID=3154363 RepID=UPI00342DB264
MSTAAAVFGTILFPTLCLAVPGGIVALVIVLGRRARQRRIAQCAAWAAHHRFQYWPEDPSALGITRRPPFAAGHSHRALDVFRGTFKGRHLHFFHYRFKTGSGKEERTHDYQLVAIDLPALRPVLDVSHENFLTRRFDKDIAFENQAFNDKFKIASPSPRFAYDVIHPRTMEWMLADPRAHVIRWRFEGAWLMTFRKGGLALDEAFYYADFLHQVLAQVPAHVWSEE